MHACVNHGYYGDEEQCRAEIEDEPNEMLIQGLRSHNDPRWRGSENRGLYPYFRRWYRLSVTELRRRGVDLPTDLPKLPTEVWRA